MKKLTKAQWNERKIHNPHNIAYAASGIVIYFRPKMPGRCHRSAAWQVHQVGKMTDPKSHFLDNGDKTFTFPFMDTKESALAKAKAFALELFGVKDWERDPWGSWHPMGDLKRAAERRVERHGQEEAK